MKVKEGQSVQQYRSKEGKSRIRSYITRKGFDEVGEPNTRKRKEERLIMTLRSGEKSV